MSTALSQRSSSNPLRPQDAQASSPAGPTLRGSDVIAALKASGVKFVLSVPDITTVDGLLRPIAADPDLRLIRVSKEDEAVGIAAGLCFCDQRSVLLIQHTGLLDSINAVRGIAVEYGLPICMLVGLLEREPDCPPRQSAKYGIRIMEPLLDVMGIPHRLLETEADAAAILPAIEDAYAHSRPVVLLIGRTLLAS
jgi:sulfopyruvate decarboxylase TPP-binding subunit